jgi:hypothetical protein
MRDCRYDNCGQAGLHIYSEKWWKEIAGSGGKKWQEDRRREDRGGKTGGGKIEAGSGGKNWGGRNKAGKN